MLKTYLPKSFNCNLILLYVAVYKDGFWYPLLWNQNILKVFLISLWLCFLNFQFFIAC